MQRKLGIVLSYLSEGVKILTALLYTPWVLRLLGKQEYGLYQMVCSLSANLGLLNLGFGSAYLRSCCRKDCTEAEQKRLNGMFLLIFSFLSILCLVLGLAMCSHARLIFGPGLGNGELEKGKQLLLVQTVSLALTFFGNLFDAYLTVREQFVFQKLVKLLQNLCSPLLTLPLLFLGYGSAAMVWISGFMALTGVLVSCHYCVKRAQMGFSFKNMPLGQLWELGSFAFFLFLNQIMDHINWSMDKYLLGRMCGTDAVAVYGVGAQVHTLYLHLSTSISGVFAPRVHRIAAEPESEGKLTELMIRVGRVQLCVLGLAVTGFVVFGKAFLDLWAGQGYEEAYYVALLLMLPMTVPLIQNLGIEIQRARNRHQARSLVYFVLAVLNAQISILMIPRWGAIGAALGTALTQILGTWLFMNWYYHRHLGLDMKAFWYAMGRIVGVMVLCIPVGWLLKSQVSGWKTFLLCAAAYTVLYGLLLWQFALHEWEKAQIRTIIKKLEGLYGVIHRKNG